MVGFPVEVYRKTPKPVPENYLKFTEGKNFLPVRINTSF
jgi:hypothetical protein